MYQYLRLFFETRRNDYIYLRQVKQMYRRLDVVAKTSNLFYLDMAIGRVQLMVLPLRHAWMVL